MTQTKQRLSPRAAATNGGHARRLAPTFLSLLLALAGCANKLELGEGLTLWESEPQPQTPDSVAAVWTEASLYHPGQAVIRGFGGRVIFHGSDQQQAVPVEGKVIVYAYDNDRPNQQDPAPDKKYVFPADNLAAHQSESKIGPSYSFWLPWDNAGGPQRRISLLTRFEDKNGRIVMSQMAHVTLPGPIVPTPGNSEVTQSPPDLPSRTALPGIGQESPGVEFPSGWSPAGPVPSLLSDIQPVSFDAPVLDPRQAAVPQTSRPPRSVTIDVAPGHANRLLSTSRSGVSRQPQGSNRPVTATGAGSVNLAPGAEVAAASQQAAPLTGFAPMQPPARNPPATRPTYDPVRRQPHREESPHRLPPTPRSGWIRPEAAPLADDAPERR